jgi:hypothetical protein
MPMRLGIIPCLVFLLVLCPASASAQDEERSGIGLFLDFIHKLSGPAFFGPGVSLYFRVSEDMYVRVSGVGRKAVDKDPDEVLETDATITMTTLQVTLDKRVVQSIPVGQTDLGAIDVGVGLALHRFAGDVDEFGHESGLLQAQWRRLFFGSVVVRAGPALHAFPPFQTDDFAPLTVNVSRHGYEAVKQFFLGAELRW